MCTTISNVPAIGTGAVVDGVGIVVTCKNSFVVTSANLNSKGVILVGFNGGPFNLVDGNVVGDAFTIYKQDAPTQFLTISSGKLLSDNKTWSLTMDYSTVGLVSGATYVVEVSNLADSNGNVIDPAHKSATFKVP